MLKKLDKTQVQRVLDYIGDDYVQCFYMYMDIIECGVEDDGLGLWVEEENEEIRCVYYRYYDCIHIFSREGCCSHAMELIEEIQPKVISSSEVIIDELRKQLPEDDYLYELNHIITATKELDGGRELDIKEAVEADVPEIAALMLKADIFSDVYDYEGLCESLTRRLNEKFGRLFLVRDESGKIIATNATNAETDKIAVVGGLVTDPDMRGQGLGRAITASTWNLVRREGKQGLAFLITDNEKTISIHRKMGFDFIGYSARLIRK